MGWRKLTVRDGDLARCCAAQGPIILLFFWKAYLPIENTLNGKRPRLVHGPRAGPTPRGGQQVTARYHAWDLRRMIYRSAGFYRDSGALARVLLWVGFYRGLLKLLSNL